MTNPSPPCAHGIAPPFTCTTCQKSGYASGAPREIESVLWNLLNHKRSREPYVVERFRDELLQIMERYNGKI